MTKYIKKVSDVIKRAISSGHGKDGPYEALFQNGHLQLFHYNTLIFESNYGEIVQLGGYSSSDRDAIGTALICIGDPRSVTRSSALAKKNNLPEKNGWYYKE